jgi:hydrogenase maturation factor HypF (carbamoyltransferase family)
VTSVGSADINRIAGTPQRIPGGMGDTGTEWSLPYTVFYAGISRQQTEALADRMRNQLTNIEREVITTSTGNWKIMKVSCSGVGTTNRISTSVPDYFTQADTFDVWVSKER